MYTHTCIPRIKYMGKRRIFQIKRAEIKPKMQHTTTEGRKGHLIEELLQKIGKKKEKKNQHNQL